MRRASSSAVSFKFVFDSCLEAAAGDERDVEDATAEGKEGEANDDIVVASLAFIPTNARLILLFVSSSLLPCNVKSA